MTRPLVSTLIVTYNAHNTIKWALQSVCDQTYNNQEILILDNNSKDDTVAILDNFQKKYKNIKIFKSEKNLWPYKWLNFLLDKAKWKYIAIQDHDDVRHPKKLEIQINFLEENQKYIGCWAWYIQFYSYLNKWSIKNEPGNKCNNVFHTTLVFKNWEYRYDPSNDFYWDAYFMQKILCKNWILYKLSDILLIHYVKNKAENFSSYWFKPTIRNISRYYQLFPINNLYDICFSFRLIITSLLPWSISAKINNFLINKKNDTHNIEKLTNENKDVENMVKYLD